MAPAFRITRKKQGGLNSAKATKRTLKFLSLSNNPQVQRIVLNAAHDSVYKAICSAFFNIAENPEIGPLTVKNRRLLKKFHPLIRRIISPALSLRRKRSVIQRGGGIFLASVLPMILSSAISFLGSAFLPRNKRDNNKQ